MRTGLRAEAAPLPEQPTQSRTAPRAVRVGSARAGTDDPVAGPLPEVRHGTARRRDRRGGAHGDSGGSTCGDENAPGSARTAPETHHREEAMLNAITRRIDAYIGELRAAREATARRRRREARAGIVAGSALAGMMTGDDHRCGSAARSASPRSKLAGASSRSAGSQGTTRIDRTTSRNNGPQREGAHTDERTTRKPGTRKYRWQHLPRMQCSTRRTTGSAERSIPPRWTAGCHSK